MAQQELERVQVHTMAQQELNKTQKELEEEQQAHAMAQNKLEAVQQELKEKQKLSHSLSAEREKLLEVHHVNQIYTRRIQGIVRASLSKHHVYVLASIRAYIHA